MKTRLLTILTCILALTLSTAGPAFAQGTADAASIAVDVVVARPAALVATAVGSVLFVLSLPIALTSKSVNKVGRALVVTPARDTFVRPLGDLDDFLDY